MLYHSTFQAYLPNIIKHGLIPNYHQNYEDSDNHQGVYFTADSELALSYSETATTVSKDIYDRGIVLLAIDSSRFDNKDFEADTNDQSNFNLVYKHPIDKNDIFICHPYSGDIYKRITDLKLPLDDDYIWF